MDGPCGRTLGEVKGMAIVTVDELRRRITVETFFKKRCIDFSDVECVILRRSWLLDCAPIPAGATVPAYEVLLRVQRLEQVYAFGGTSLVDLRTRATETARLLKVPLCELTSAAP